MAFKDLEHASPKRRVRALLSEALGLVGWDLIRTYRQPERSFLGLDQLPIRTVIDVGANTGQFALAAMRAFPRSQVISFEPLPHIFEQLAEAAKASHGRLVPVQMALGERRGTGWTSMHLHMDWTPSSSLLEASNAALEVFPEQRRQKTLEVPLDTLDGYFGSDGHPMLRPDILIKLDCQGFDDRVIRGGPRLFSQARACVVEVNLDVLYTGQPSFKDIFCLLDEHGLRYVGNLQQTYARDGHVMFIDAIFLRD
jgi:FkbM family methyltransferase